MSRLINLNDNPLTDRIKSANKLILTDKNHSNSENESETLQKDDYLELDKAESSPSNHPIINENELMNKIITLKTDV